MHFAPPPLRKEEKCSFSELIQPIWKPRQDLNRLVMMISIFDFAELDFRCSDVPMGERMDFHQSEAISGLLGIRCLVVVERSQRLQGGS